MKRTNVIPTLIIKTALAMVGIVIFALLFNSISPNGLNLITAFREINVGDTLYKIPIFQTRRALKTNQAAVVHAPQEIGLEKAFQYFQEGRSIFIDTRSTEDYNTAHISLAISFPLETQDYIEILLPGLSRNQRIVTYCDGEDCSQSIDLAVYLGEIGFNDVYFFFGGWELWQRAGYPQNSGDQP